MSEFLFFLFFLIYLVLAASGLPCSAHRLSLVAASGGLLFIAVRQLLIAVASLVAKHGL